MIGSRRDLIVVDLDGTCLNEEPLEHFDAELVDLLAHLRIPWAINSDRYLADILGLLAPFPDAAWPIAILTMQRFVHVRNESGDYEPDLVWNAHQNAIHRGLWDQISPLFPEWVQQFSASFGIIDKLVNDEVFSFQLPPDQVEAFRRRLLALLVPWPEAKVSGSIDWVYVCHVSFSKSPLLRRLASTLAMDTHGIVAVGDGINDLEMLDGSLTNLVGCPANACEQIARAVRNAGGYVASEPLGKGTAEVIRHYLWQGAPQSPPLLGSSPSSAAFRQQ